MNFFTPTNILLILVDIFIALMSAYGGLYLRFISNISFERQEFIYFYPKVVMFTLFVIMMSFFFDLYSVEKGDGKKEILLKVMLSAVMVSLGLGAFYYFVPSLELGRGILFFALSILILFQFAWHFGYSKFLRLPAVARKVLILGTGPVAKNMGLVLGSNNNGLALAGYVNCLGEAVNVPENNIIGSGEKLLNIAARERVQKIVVSLSERRGTFPVNEVLNCKLNGIEIIDGPSFYEELTGKLMIENMNPSHLIFSDRLKITVFRRYVKRILDVLFASAGIIIALPFIMFIPIIIKLDSRGPVLFKQDRVGEGERVFTVCKFRTMVDGAEKKTGPVWSKTGDTRITRIGRLMRKTRLDELPQLFNVLKGDMSFIGPRPERPFFVESLSKQIPYYSERHCVRPGVTGWAQVRYEYGDSIEDAIEKLRYDLYYIKYQSISLEILIVLDTIKVIFFGRGGR
jgi:sugar transferase (PEP-CTERM system associated)